MAPVLIAAGVAAGIVLLGRSAAARVPCSYPYPKPANQGVPMAVGDPCPLWPVYATRNPKAGEVSYKDSKGRIIGNAARRFFATRSSDGEGRHHIGIDLYADAGDLLVATESGVVVGLQTFHLSTWALLLQSDTGPVLLYGEVEPYSWRDYGILEGTPVAKGQPIARVGLMDSGSHMLHFEAYKRGITQNRSWMVGQKNPGVLDPTDYLLRARESLRGVA